MISTLQALKTFLWGWNCCPSCSTIAGFRDIRLPKNLSDWMTPNWTWRLNNHKYSITLNAYPRGPNFGPFRSTISRFRDTTCTRSAKIVNAPNDPKLNLNTQQSKVLSTYLILTPDVQIFFRSAVRSAVFKIQGRRKSDMHRKTPNWTWTLNSQNYPVYTKYFPQRSKCWSVSLCD